MRDGRLFLVEASAFARVASPAVLAVLEPLGEQGLLASCPTVDLEVGYSARTPAEHAAIRRRRALAFARLPLHEAIGERAEQVPALLARRSQHRSAGVIDLLTAAVAEHYDATVLHYDADFDHIAAVSGQDVRWVVPREPSLEGTRRPSDSVRAHGSPA